jgi:hypothetical protein
MAKSSHGQRCVPGGRLGVVWAFFWLKTGDPSRIRTCNPRSRNPLLYPVELWDRHGLYSIVNMKNPLCRQARSEPKFLELVPTGVVPRVQFSLDVSRIEVATLPMIGQPRFHMAGLQGRRSALEVGWVPLTPWRPSWSRSPSASADERPVLVEDRLERGRDHRRYRDGGVKDRLQMIRPHDVHEQAIAWLVGVVHRAMEQRIVEHE